MPKTHGIETVVDDVLEVLAHSDLSHQLVLISVHSSQLSNMSKYVLKSISKLRKEKYTFTV